VGITDPAEIAEILATAAALSLLRLERLRAELVRKLKTGAAFLAD